MTTNVHQPVLNGLGDRIIAEAQDAIIYADRDGTICLWNAGAENVFGHAAEDALGQSLDLIIPDKLQQRHWDGWEKVMATGQTKYGQEPLAVPGLRARDTRFAGVLHHDAARPRGRNRWNRRDPARRDNTVGTGPGATQTSSDVGSEPASSMTSVAPCGGRSARAGFPQSK
jgi:hypothetical protein